MVPRRTTPLAPCPTWITMRVRHEYDFQLLLRRPLRWAIFNFESLLPHASVLIIERQRIVQLTNLEHPACETTFHSVVVLPRKSCSSEDYFATYIDDRHSDSLSFPSASLPESLARAPLVVGVAVLDAASVSFLPPSPIYRDLGWILRDDRDVRPLVLQWIPKAREDVDVSRRLLISALT